MNPILSDLAILCRLGNIFRSMCQSFCPGLGGTRQGGICIEGRGLCVVGAMHGKGSCVAESMFGGGGAYMPGGNALRGVYVVGGGAYMARGCACRRDGH